MINELSVSVSNYSCTADDVCNFFFVSKNFYLRDDVSSCNDIAEAVCIIIEKNQWNIGSIVLNMAILI